MLMHNFGEKRFEDGFVDDLRSLKDQNTRLVGTFDSFVWSCMGFALTSLTLVQATLPSLLHFLLSSKKWRNG